MTDGYRFAMSCPTCGGPLDHRSSETIAPDRVTAECWCSDCMIVWRIDLCATPVLDMGAHIRAVPDDRRERACAAIGQEGMSLHG